MSEPVIAPYVYVIVRRDMMAATILVQAVHAAAEMAFKLDPLLRPSIHPYLVVCTVPDEKALRKTYAKLQSKGVNMFHWCEPDLNHEMTAIASEPISSDKRELFRHYTLLRFPELDLQSSIEQL